MEFTEFKKWLDDNEISLRDFTELTKLSYSGCSKWKNSGIPSWVDSWCKLYEENRKLIKIKDLAKEICK